MSLHFKKGAIMRMVLIIAVVVAGSFLLYQTYSSSSGESGDSGSSEAALSGANKDKPTIKVALCSWPIFAGGPLYNEGMRPNDNSRYLKEYGFNVEFQIIDDFQSSRDALVAGAVDVLWGTMDALPMEAAALQESGVKVYAQTDWSRGGDICVAYTDAGIESINDFKGKSFAITPWTPSHSMFLQNLRSVSLTQDDVTIVTVDSPERAAQAFIEGIVDAAYVWSPFEVECLAHAREAGRSAKIITSTKVMSNSIPAVWLAKESVVNEKFDMIAGLFEGWLQGNAEINTDPSQFDKAVELNFSGIALWEDRQQAREAMSLGRFVTSGDNANFFGLNRGYKGVTGKQIYSEMGKLYQQAGELDYFPKWEMIYDSRIVEHINRNLIGEIHSPEGSIIEQVASEEIMEAKPVSSKSVSIYFNTNSSDLDPNAKMILNREFELEATTNTGAYIRIVGNTDNTGSSDYNRQLSKRRAQAVADYMSSQWGIEKNRIIVIGNGPEKAIEDGVSGSNDMYRRTDFEIVANI